MKIPYIRLATNYFKVAEKPSVFGASTIVRIPWNYETIRRDHGAEYEKKIPRYDGTVCFPEHLDFKYDIGTFYNIYNPLTHKPQDGSIENTMKFLKHIFDEQLDIGLDYLKLLYINPLNMLPIFCLVSTERNTGKTTFLKWLKLIFQRNATYLDKNSFSSQFNDDWVNCLLVMQDEVLFNLKEYTERIKNLSTSNNQKEEGKFKGRAEVDFFAKFIICTNNERDFIKIDPEETRFWVRKINPLSEGHKDVEMIDKLGDEIPAFLNFLLEREFITSNQDRMWFTEKQTETMALIRLKLANSPKLNQEIALALLDAMDFIDEDSIKVIPNDVKNLMGSTNKYASTNDVRQVLREHWSLIPQKNSFPYSRPVLYNTNNYVIQESKGRYFEIDRKFLESKFDDLMTE